MKPSPCENTNSAQISVEDLNLPEPVPVFSEPVESHDSPAHTKEEESCHYDDGLVQGQLDILVTEPIKPTVVDSKEEDQVEPSRSPVTVPW